MKIVEQTCVVEQRENIIASACLKLTEDLKKIPPLAFAFFFNLGDMTAVFDEINSIVDRRFKDGSMSFSCTGECFLNWEQIPATALDLEFADTEVSVFFRLRFAEDDTSVNLHHIAFHNSTGDPSVNTRILEERFMHAAA